MPILDAYFHATVANQLADLCVQDVATCSYIIVRVFNALSIYLSIHDSAHRIVTASASLISRHFPNYMLHTYNFIER